MKYLIVQVYWYFDQVTGEYRYRISDPGNSIASHPNFDVINVHVFHPLLYQFAMTADLMILHLMPDPEILRIIQIRKKLGKPTVFEIADNFLNMGPWIPEDSAYRNPLIRQNFLYFASLCDGVQFSTREVQKTFGFINPNHIVFENQSNHYAPTAPEASRPFVFGWGGSKGHEQDLAAVAPAIIDFCHRHPDAVFSYMGYPPIFERHFAAIPEQQRRVNAAGPIEDYYAFTNSLHVGLAPLSDTEFNRCRSDVKFLEYASHQTVPVLADAPPYRAHAVHGGNALIFSNNEELTQVLEDLYQHPDKLTTLAGQAYRYTNIKRNLADHLGRRIAFFRGMLRHDPFLSSVPELPDCTGLMAYLRLAVDAHLEGRFTGSEQYLDKVLELHGSYHLAHVWKAKNMLALGQSRALLDTYSDYRCDPVYLDLLLECLITAAQREDNPVWQRYLEAVADPALRSRLDPRRTRDQEKLTRDILSTNPYDFEALGILGRMLTRRGDPEGLALLERAAFIAPEDESLARRIQRTRERIHP